MAAMVGPKGSVNPAGWDRATKAISNHAATMRSAANSTGMWEASQVKLTGATAGYIEKLEKQRITIRDMFKERSNLYKAAYRDQLRLQNAQAMVGPGGEASLFVPSQALKSWDTMNNKIGWFQKNMHSASITMQNWGKNMQWAGRQLMVGFTVPLAAVGAASATFAYQVDKQLTRVQKVYNFTANQNATTLRGMDKATKESNDLRAASWATATKATREYGAAATDTLDVQAALAATGKRGAELQDATNQVMRISTLGELDHQDAIAATIALQSTFKMNTDQLTKSFNYMNAVENATSLETKDFAKAIPIAAGPIKAFGGDIKELGTLLVAMKERGIQAAQGANALKATMSRLSRPSKTVSEEFQSITGHNLSKIVDQSKSLSEIFMRIGDITKTLDDAQRRKVFAGVFGGWQVTRMMAMVDGLQDVKKGVGQAGTAFKLAQQDSSKWAQIADQELQKIQQSASGRFKIAVETIKNDLTGMGQTFLEMGTTVLTIISKIIHAFNGLPSGVKTIGKWGAIFLALAGPVVMITGLFANLIGTFGRMSMSVLGLFTNFKVLNAESAANAAAMKLAEKGMLSAGQAGSILVTQMAKLAEAHAATAESAGTATAASIKESEMLRAEAFAAEKAAAEYAALNEARSMQGLPVNPQATRIASQRSVDAIAYHSMADEAAARESAAAAASTSAVAKNTERASVASKTMAASGHLFALSMLASLVSGDKTVDKISMIGMGLSFALPMVVGMGKGFAAMRTSIAESGGLMTVLGSKTSALGPIVSKLFNPVTIGVTALVAGFLEFNHLANAGIKKQEEINNSTQNWADATGIVLDKMKQVNVEADKYAKTQSISDRAAIYQKANPGLTDKYISSTADEKTQILKQEYSKAIDAGMSKAATNEMLTGLVYLDTHSVDDATKKIEALNKEIQNMGPDWQRWLRMDAIFSRINSGLTDVTGNAVVASKGIADTFNQTFSNMGNVDRAKEFDTLTEAFDKSWRQVFKDVDAQYSETLDQMGVHTGKQYRKMIADFNSMQAGNMSTDAFTGKYNISADQAQSFFDQISTGMDGAASKTAGMVSREKEMVKELANFYKITGDVYTLEQLRESLYAGGQIGLSIDDAKKKFQDYLRYNYALSDNQKLQYLNQLRMQAGIGKVKNLTDGWGYATKGVTDETKKTKRGVDDVTSATSRAAAAANAVKAAWAAVDFGSVMKDAMTATEDRLAGIASANFDSKMQTAMNAYSTSQNDRMDALSNAQDRASTHLQNAQDRASNALENRQQRATDAFEAQWKKRTDAVTAHYDSRIKSINDTMKAENKAEANRKRIFDAEMARIERLNEAQNQNIDFNVALDTGQFDQAAKIRNDMAAKTEQYSLQDKNDRMSAQHDAEVERLQTRIDKFNELKDKRLKALQRIEDAERKHLERMQKREKAALERSQTRQTAALARRQKESEKALQKEVDNNIAAQQEIWDNRKTKVDQAIALFQAYVPKNEKDLREHIARISAKYDDFNVATTGKFNKTSIDIRKELYDQIKLAATKTRDDIAWEAIGRSEAKKMLSGSLGMTMGQFKKWMTSGKWPAGAGDIPHKAGGGGGGGKKTQGPPGGHSAPIGSIQHEGGEVGSASNSRKGVARTAGIHPSERVVLARKGEYIVNRESSKAHRAVLDAINYGTMGNGRPVDDLERREQQRISSLSVSGSERGAGPMPATAGIMAAMVRAAMVQTANQGIQTNAQRSLDTYWANQVSGFYGAAPAGSYGGQMFDRAQLRNARIIADVGSGMGMTAREIEIGIMTAITESGLRNLHYGDRDSQGLFQQRTSQGWGTVDQITDPEYAARKFFQALKGDADRGSDSPWLAAQHVQRSAYSDGSNYKPHWDDAQAIFKAMQQMGGGYAGSTKANHTGTRAINWATARLGDAGWYGLCQKFVRMALGAGPGFPDAISAWRGANHKHPITRAKSVPAGVPVYWSGGTHGHVALSTGNGGIISTDYPTMGRIGRGTIMGLTHAWGKTLQGWTEDINGKRIFGVPGLAVGGHVKHDNTIANLHKGETVLTADLSKKLSDGINLMSKGPRSYGDTWGGLWNRDAYYTALNGPQAKGTTDNTGTKNTGGGTNPSGGKIPDAKGPGDVKIGAYNFKHGHAPMSDVEKIMQRVDVFGTSETRTNNGKLSNFLGQHGWGYFQGTRSDTGLAWNRGKLQEMNKGSMRIEGTLWNHQKMSNAIPYAQFKNQHGQRFWVMSAHTQVHGYRGGALGANMRKQYAQIRGLYSRLEKSAPTFIAGDLNNPHPVRSGIGPKGVSAARGKGIDNIIYRKGQARLLGSWELQGTGFSKHHGPTQPWEGHHKNAQVHSDHPFIWSAFNLPSLAKGAESIRWDNTLANLHKDETVLTADLSNKFKQGVDNFANGGNTEYNINVNVNNPAADADDIARKVLTALKFNDARKPGSRKK